MTKINLLAFGAHPDDVELGASGTLLKHKALGQSIGIIDLTEGELGTRGGVQDRRQEAAEAAKILGLTIRENLGLKDGFFGSSNEEIMEVIKIIRRYQPDIILANTINDRHPDHPKGADLLTKAAFYSGLAKIETKWKGEIQACWRPKNVYHYIQFYNIQPELIVDISGHLETKLQSVLAYKSQFYNPNSKEPETVISSKNFLDSVRYRALDMGRIIGTEAGEGFNVARPVGVNNLFDLF